MRTHTRRRSLRTPRANSPRLLAPYHSGTLSVAYRFSFQGDLCSLLRSLSPLPTAATECLKCGMQCSRPTQTASASDCYRYLQSSDRHAAHLLHLLLAQRSSLRRDGLNTRQRLREDFAATRHQPSVWASKVDTQHHADFLFIVYTRYSSRYSLRSLFHSLLHCSYFALLCSEFALLRAAPSCTIIISYLAFCVN